MRFPPLEPPAEARRLLKLNAISNQVRFQNRVGEALNALGFGGRWNVRAVDYDLQCVLLGGKANFTLLLDPNLDDSALRREVLLQLGAVDAAFAKESVDRPPSRSDDT